MYVEEIRLNHFRNYENLTVVPHRQMNLIFGHNGAGKTNLLEALHYCALGKSHRDANDRNTVQRGEPAALCSVIVRKKTGRDQIAISLYADQDQKKAVTINGKKISRFSELMGCFRCVIFSPEDLRLIREGPSLRRRYLDMMISQYNREYFIALQQYKAALDQRNAMMKAMHEGLPVHGYMLEEFENVLARNAEMILKERMRATRKADEGARELYGKIADQEKEVLRISYHSSLGEAETAEEMARKWKENREQDERYGTTMIGPHRDQMDITLNQLSIRNFASQGQIRTAALSLKLIQMKIMEEDGGEKPVLLLDDVMSELDRDRRERLLCLTEGYQTFVTCTDQDDLLEDHTQRSYLVHAGEKGAEWTEISEGMPMPVLQEPEPDFR